MNPYHKEILVALGLWILFVPIMCVVTMKVTRIIFDKVILKHESEVKNEDKV